MSAGNSAKFKITDSKLHILIVTLSTKENVNLTKQLSEGFKRSVYWNSYRAKPAKVFTDGRNFYDQPINDFIKQDDEVRKVSTVIQKKLHGSGTITLMISNEEMSDIIKIV